MNEARAQAKAITINKFEQTKYHQSDYPCVCACVSICICARVHFHGLCAVPCRAVPYHAFLFVQQIIFYDCCFFTVVYFMYAFVRSFVRRSFCSMGIFSSLLWFILACSLVCVCVSTQNSFNSWRLCIRSNILLYRRVNSHCKFRFFPMAKRENLHSFFQLFLMHSLSLVLSHFQRNEFTAQNFRRNVLHNKFLVL